MPRVAPAVSMDPTTQATLLQLVRSPSTRQGLVQRCRIVLAAVAGKSNQQIADELEMPEVTVGKWRRCFCQQGSGGSPGCPSCRSTCKIWPGSDAAGADPRLPTAGALQPLECTNARQGLAAAVQHRAPDPGCFASTASSDSHLYVQPGS